MIDHELICNELEKEMPDIAFDFENESDPIRYDAVIGFINYMATTFVAALHFKYSVLTRS